MNVLDSKTNERKQKLEEKLLQIKQKMQKLSVTPNTIREEIEMLEKSLET